MPERRPHGLLGVGGVAGGHGLEVPGYRQGRGGYIQAPGAGLGLGRGGYGHHPIPSRFYCLLF